MSTSSKDNIRLNIVSISKTQNLSVSMTVPFGCSENYISILQNYVPCQAELSEGAEESAYAYALFLLLKEKMTMGAVDANKFRIDHLVCRSHGDSLVIAWNTQGTGSSLKRTIGAVLKYLKPHSIFKGYTNCIRHLGGKADRDVFNYLANKMIDALKSIHFVAVGKINANVKADDVLVAIGDKFEKGEKESKSAAPEKHAHPAYSTYEIKCSSGAVAVFVADYLMRTKMNIHVCGKSVMVGTPNFDSTKKKLKEKRLIDAYCQTKFEKQGEQANKLFAYYSNSNAFASGENIMHIVNMKDISDAIHKAL